MHNIRIICLFTIGMFAVADFPTYAQKEIEVSYEKDDTEKFFFTNQISFLRHGQSERYVWKPSSSDASNYNAQGSLFDISHVLTIKRNIEYTSRLTLPDNSSINADDVFILGVDDESFSMDEKGQYKTSLSVIDAVTQDGKPLYTCWASVDSVERINHADLNAMETAIAYLLKVFPLFADQTSDKDFQHLKELIGKLDETQEFAKAIDSSIVQNGFFNLNDVETQYDNAIQKVINLIGWDDLFKERTANGVPPKLSSVRNNTYYGGGMRIELDKSEWVHSYSAGKNIWRCEMTAYNYNRFGYTAIVKGIIDKEGHLKLSEDDWYEQLRYIVKPQRVTSSFFDHIEFWKIENWDKISEFYEQTYQFVVGDIELDEMTWDEEKKKGIKYDFEEEGDVLVALGPINNVNVMVYNVIQLFGKPIMKKVQKKFKKVVFDNLHSELDVTEYFINKIVLDAGFITSTTLIMADDQLTKSDKYVKVAEKVLDKFKEYLLIELETYAQAGIETYLWSGTGVKVLDKYVIGAVDLASLQNCFDDAFSALKKVKKYGDFLLGGLGLLEGDVIYSFDLDFQDPGFIVPEIDGYDM